jgi:hypothetical protein
VRHSERMNNGWDAVLKYEGNTRARAQNARKPKAGLLNPPRGGSEGGEESGDLRIAISDGLINRGPTRKTADIVGVNIRQTCSSAIMRCARGGSMALWMNTRRIYKLLQLPTAYLMQRLSAARGFFQSNRMTKMPPRLCSKEREHA